VTNFQKSPSAESSPPSASLIFNIGSLKFYDFGLIVVLQADYDKIELQNSNNAISVTSSPLPH